MSDNQTGESSPETSPAVASDAASAERVAGESSEPQPNRSDDTSNRPATWPGTLGLLISLAAVAGVGYLWLGQQKQASVGDDLLRTRGELQSQTANVQSLAGELESLAAADKALDSDLNALTDRIERQLEELPARMTRVETTLDKIPGIANEATSAWLRAEAEYFMRIAHAQLSLAGNVDVALRALNLADEKLRDIGDPGLTRVRAKLADERTALKAVPRPDAEGIVLELGSLADSLPNLPLARTAPGRFRQTAQSDVEATGWRRAQRVIIDALSTIVSVRRNDESVTPLMSAADEAMLVRGLDIEFQIARLAIIRSDGDLYARSMQAITDRLNNYFDTDADSVKSTLSAVTRLSEADLPDKLPDVSGSLRLMLNLDEGSPAL